MLDIEGIDVFYGSVQALRGVSLQVGDGEAVALLGPNGAGKTTTLRALSGLTPYRAGRVRVCGEDLAGVPPHQVVSLGVAHLPQGRELFAELTVVENLRLGHWARRRDKAHLRERTGYVFELFSRLGERAHQAAGTLSGGEQQMLAVGRALMCEPRILLVDEASMGLSPLITRQLFNALRTVNEAGTAVLVVEQFVDLALEFAARAYVLAKGEVKAVGRSQDIASDPALLSAYLGVDPTPAGAR